jgi:hypothetical protein
MTDGTSEGQHPRIELNELNNKRYTYHMLSCIAHECNLLYYLAQSSDETHLFHSIPFILSATPAADGHGRDPPEPAGKNSVIKTLLGCQCWGRHEIDIDINLVCVRVVLL